MVDATPAELAEKIAEILDNKKAREVKVMKVGDKTIIADYFVLANGNSSTQVRALIDEVEYQMGRRGVDPSRVEGGDGNSWRVLDYSSVIVHVFDREAREFYNLDKLYTDFE
ncbi:MAG: ribosome silencing factor [Clostridia bacterium]|nr:ribosome silencing factor [Clostridia bacterium]MBR2431961.1 ribosome silencing factor [Clostridia bacterium]